MVAGDPDHGMCFTLTPWNTNDFKEWKRIIKAYNFPDSVTHLAMDKWYSFYETLELCKNKEIEAVVPPKSSFKNKWEYNRNIYAYRNEVERLFHRIKNFRRVATRYDKLDFTYASFVSLSLIALILKVIC